MKKIGELNTLASYFVIYYDEKARVNPYRIYWKYWKDGWHKKMVVQYADLLSCTSWLNNYVMNHNEERRK